MRRFLVLIAICVATAAPAAEPTFGVLRMTDDKDGNAVPPSTMQAIQDAFAAELGKPGSRAVKAPQVSQELTPARAISLGKELNVDFLLTGSVTEYGVTPKLNVKVFDAKTGKLAFSGQERFNARADESNRSPKDSVAKLAGRIMAGLKGK